MPLIRPQTKKRTALLHQLKVVFRGLRSQPIRQVIEIINPILRGWVQYFSIGNASQCFSFIRNWVEQKIRRHLAPSPAASGLRLEAVGSAVDLQVLGLFDDYRVRRPKAAPDG
jgi:RNA-directed DNA polymerase